jgi:hypothetical protein
MYKQFGHYKAETDDGEKAPEGGDIRSRPRVPHCGVWSFGTVTTLRGESA